MTRNNLFDTFPPCPEHGGTKERSCQTCRARTAAISRTYRRRRTYGTWRSPHDPVDIEEIQPHIRKFDALGYPRKRLASIFGVSHETIKVIMTGKRYSGKVQRYVQSGTAKRILAVDPDTMGVYRARVSRVGSNRRLLALACLGWPHRHVINSILGKPLDADMRYEFDRPTIRVELADKITEFYERYSSTVGPSRQVAALAIAKRTRSRQPRGREIAPPHAWEDINMDDINARPIGMRRPRGTRNPVPSQQKRKKTCPTPNQAA